MLGGKKVVYDDIDLFFVLLEFEMEYFGVFLVFCLVLFFNIWYNLWIGSWCLKCVRIVLVLKEIVFELSIWIFNFLDV